MTIKYTYYYLLVTRFMYFIRWNWSIYKILDNVQPKSLTHSLNLTGSFKHFLRNENEKKKNIRTLPSSHVTSLDLIERIK